MHRQELTEVFRRHKSDQEILHDLMPLRTREILLVAPIYDAFALEQDGLISETVFGEYHQLNLTSAPRITSVSSREEAAVTLRSRHFDLVFILGSPKRYDAVGISRAIRATHPQLPIFLLLTDNAAIETVVRHPTLREHFDQIFVWNGHSEIFFAMVKYHEDQINVANDTRVGLVRVILLVEGSIRCYSRCLPLLYAEVVKQTQRLMGDESLDPLKKILRMRARPKILLATSREEAMTVVETYRDQLLAVVTDVDLGREGEAPAMTGMELIRELRAIRPDLPILVQSSLSEARELAGSVGAGHVHKEAENFSGELAAFFYQQLGFGDFVFKNRDGHEIHRARNLEELRAALHTVPIESILYHASCHHFSAWLMARGEIRTAQMVHAVKVEDFTNPHDLRAYLINVGQLLQMQQIRGRVVDFDPALLGAEHVVFRLAGGSLGGKGHGIAFVNSLLGSSNLAAAVPDVCIKIPRTFVVGVDAFSGFIDENRLQPLILACPDHSHLQQRFLAAALPAALMDQLRLFVQHLTCPLAVRSSGLLEDAVSHPLSGLYQTYFLPNNHPDPEVRLRELVDAIKLVYASVYTREARSYFEAISYKIEEERMAVVIQQVVGKAFGTRFYPHVSGVAQSYNFYPYASIAPEDGVAMIALGLGRYVVGGEQSHRFCPAWPNIELTPPEDRAKASQNHYYALDLSRSAANLQQGEAENLLELGLPDAEADGALTWLASVWNGADQRLEVGLHRRGPRVLDFAYILKYEKYPLSRTIREVLGVAQMAMETPVEIEFAVNLDEQADGKRTFYLLQIKHLLRDQEECNLDLRSIKDSDVFLLTDKGMGNGVIDDVTDVVWVDPQKFDKGRTVEMASELERINLACKDQNRRYLLLGPGRWGSRDRWLGIPINWPQISQARVIVEYALEHFQVDASLGSHFFHNVTSMNIGYFTVPHGHPPCRIDWEWLRQQHVQHRGDWFVHSRLPSPARVVMDGRRSLSVVFKG